VPCPAPVPVPGTSNSVIPAVWSARKAVIKAAVWAYPGSAGLSYSDRDGESRCARAT
jgi:hypothetical protein